VKIPVRTSPRLGGLTCMRKGFRTPMTHTLEAEVVESWPETSQKGFWTLKAAFPQIPRPVVGSIRNILPDRLSNI
jgi:hypothetical protein